MSLLDDHKTNARHFPHAQHLALAILLQLLMQLLCTILEHFGMLVQLLLDQLMVDNGIGVYQVMAFRAKAHEIVRIVRAVHAGGHNVMQLHLVII